MLSPYSPAPNPIIGLDGHTFKSTSLTWGYYIGGSSSQGLGATPPPFMRATSHPQHPHTHVNTHLHTRRQLVQTSLLSPPPTPTLCPAGEITTTSLLDRETKSEYILIVRAVDGGVGHNQKTGIATVSAHAPRDPCSPAHLQGASVS